MKRTLIPDKLNAWMKREKLTAQLAADRLGINRRTIENWRQGRTEPEGLARIALLAVIAPPKPAKEKEAVTS